MKRMKRQLIFFSIIALIAVFAIGEGIFNSVFASPVPAPTVAASVQFNAEPDSDFTPTPCADSETEEEMDTDESNLDYQTADAASNGSTAAPTGAFNKWFKIADIHRRGFRINSNKRSLTVAREIYRPPAKPSRENKRARELI